LETSTDSLPPGSEFPSGIKIKILGIGGAGTNTVGRLELDELDAKGETEIAVINTDAQSLADSPIKEKLLIGRSLTRGLGAGGEVEIGRQAAELDREAIEKLIGEVDLVVLVVGLGGGTGSAAAPVIAEVASKTDALILAFATLPFNFESERRRKIAEGSIGELRQLVHGLVPIPNDVLLQEGEADEDVPMLNAFAATDRWIGRAVNCLRIMLLKAGLINLDLGSLRALLRERGGRTVFGVGVASGEDCVKEALGELAICPLLHLGDRPERFDRILINIVGGADLGISRVHQIMSQLSKRFNCREDIIFGAVVDPARNQSLEICVLGKAGVDVPESTPRPGEVESTAGSMMASESLNLESAIAQDDRPPRTVHQSKLRGKKRQVPDADQEEFLFVEADAQRGYFEKTDRNLYKGEDLDVPTFMRNGLKIKIKI